MSLLICWSEHWSGPINPLSSTTSWLCATRWRKLQSRAAGPTATRVTNGMSPVQFNKCSSNLTLISCPTGAVRYWRRRCIHHLKVAVEIRPSFVLALTDLAQLYAEQRDLSRYWSVQSCSAVALLFLALNSSSSSFLVPQGWGDFPAVLEASRVGEKPFSDCPSALRWLFLL